MNKKDSLGDRMKEFYESKSKPYLIRRMPAMMRFDGKSFHTFTRGMRRPFCTVLRTAMQEACKAIYEEVQGAKLVYSQSDEITIFMTDYDTLVTDAWFNYNTNKMNSIGAVTVSNAFNVAFVKAVNDGIASGYFKDEKEIKSYTSKFWTAKFDARPWNIPKEEVANNFIWRQQDCTRNSISMVAQYYFKHAELQNKSSNDMQNMLFTQQGINWNEYDVQFKRGFCVSKDGVDTNIPIFTQDRDYIERYVYLDE